MSTYLVSLEYLTINGGSGKALVTIECSFLTADDINVAVETLKREKRPDIIGGVPYMIYKVEDQ